FHLGAEHPASARWVTVGWLVVYAVVPVAMVTLVWIQTRRERDGARALQSRHRPPELLRGLLVLLAVALVGLGTALLLVPLEASKLWPWTLTELTGRAVGAWLVGLGWISAHARLIDDLPSIRPMGLTGAAFVLLQAVAMLRHGDELDRASPTATGYVVVLAVIGVVSGWILVATGRRATT
ncbi:MAG: hypothetical protein ACXWDM_15210, partial [Nocardioides sp.]